MKRIFLPLLVILVLCSCAGSVPEPYDYALGDYIELGQYKGISYTPYGDPDSSAAMPEDTVTAEVIAMVEGTEQLFAGVYSFEVGYSNFLPGFDEALVGMEPGDTASMKLTLPQVYDSAPEYAGRDAEVQVRLISIDYSPARQANRDALWSIVLDGSTVLKYPEEELREYQEDFRACYEAFAKEYGLSLDEYLSAFFGTNSSGLDELCLKNAESSVKRDLVLYAIARAENLVPDREDLEKAKPTWLITYGYESEEAMPEPWSSPEVSASLEKLAVQELVMDFIFDSSVCA
ncbi:MAG: FKBP-type peptidyl-prolyl cis-trans isomerase [Candidatus Heteroscillospira sp.]|jgi:FKBP-type peptidyl-prolyl cis-trans isomerase (trigger factor)